MRRSGGKAISLRALCHLDPITNQPSTQPDKLHMSPPKCLFLLLAKILKTIQNQKLEGIHLNVIKQMVLLLLVVLLSYLFINENIQLAIGDVVQPSLVDREAVG